MELVMPYPPLSWVALFPLEKAAKKYRGELKKMPKNIGQRARCVKGIVVWFLLFFPLS
jgi:hypothetical protein